MMGLSLAATTTAFAVPPHGRSLFHLSSRHMTRLERPNNMFATSSSSSPRKPPSSLTMFFSSLFGPSPPSYIDYTALDFPGNEMGKSALESKTLVNSERYPNLTAATFAGGCFWGLELAYQRVPGVEYTAVGYTQGKEESPTYKQVCSGATSHTEATFVYYDPSVCSYEDLLDVFFDKTDPTQVNGQGNDRGTQYRTGVYFHTPEQEAKAKARFEEEAPKFRRKIASELKAATPFWPAEKYHQQYLEKGGQNAQKGASERIRCYG